MKNLILIISILTISVVSFSQNYVVREGLVLKADSMLEEFSQYEYVKAKENPWEIVYYGEPEMVDIKMVSPFHFCFKLRQTKAVVSDGFEVAPIKVDPKFRYTPHKLAWPVIMLYTSILLAIIGLVSEYMLARKCWLYSACSAFFIIFIYSAIDASNIGVVLTRFIIPLSAAVLALVAAVVSISPNTKRYWYVYLGYFLVVGFKLYLLFIN